MWFRMQLSKPVGTEGPVCCGHVVGFYYEGSRGSLKREEGEGARERE